MKRRLTQVIRLVSCEYEWESAPNSVSDTSKASFSEPTRAAEDLQEFANMNEQRLYKLIRVCMDPKIGLKELVKASVS